MDVLKQEIKQLIIEALCPEDISFDKANHPDVIVGDAQAGQSMTCGNFAGPGKDVWGAVAGKPPAIHKYTVVLLLRQKLYIPIGGQFDLCLFAHEAG